jgi:hypothetical protein
LLKEKSVISPFTEDPVTSPLLTAENRQMNCNAEYVLFILDIFIIKNNLFQSDAM